MVENPGAGLAATGILDATMKDIEVLLVDDEPDFRQTLAKRIEKRGITAKQAGSGEECLSILSELPLKVIVLDVKMPGMDGIQALRHIKERHPKTEVILLTGYATTTDGVEGIKSGAFDYLSKPVELEHLLSKIRQAHEKVRSEEERTRGAEFRAKMEQQMIATERLASLGTLAAGVAHEINNPLAIIKEAVGWMKQLLLKGELAGMPRKQDFDMALDKADKSVERAKRITHQLLGFVRKDYSVPAMVDLGALAEDAVQLVSREASNRAVELAREVDHDLGPIWVDPYPLRQVFVNLLTNAIHASGSGDKISIIVKDIGERINLVVRDTGEGIPKENLERIFEPFFTTRPPGQGTGLGLFVARGIVEKLGGTIEVKSQVGQGTAFDIKIPKKTEGFSNHQSLE
jgi:two-component system NtrC family sensor kinase